VLNCIDRDVERACDGDGMADDAMMTLLLLLMMK
jgi:hypothetical protein